MRLSEVITEEPIDSLLPYHDNPRIGNVEKIAESLAFNGQYRPIVVNAANREILAGNHTWQAAKSLGWSTISVSFLHDLTDDDAARIVLADNRLNDLAEYDNAALAELLTWIGDLTGTGYEQADVDAILDSLTSQDEPTALTDPDDVPEAPETPQSRLGDVWTMGPHRLLVGDSTESLDVLMQGEEAHLVFTDPPWNVNYGDQKEGNIQNYKPRKILNDNLGQEFGAFCAGFSSRLKSHSRPGAPIYLVMSAQEWPVIHATLSESGFHWSSTIIWAKDRLVLSRKDYHTQYEPIWYGWNDSAGRLVTVADRKQSDLWEIPRPARSDLHPTTKPVELVARAIRNSSQIGDVVLDPFGGSGSTLIACHSTNRICRTVELDPRYADVILRRYMEHTGDTPTNQDGERFRGPVED